MDVNLILDSAARAAPASVKNTWQQAANMLDAAFTDNVTININVDYSGTGGGASAGPDNSQFETYSSVYSYLTSHASPGDSTFDFLPPSPINGQTMVAVWNSQLKLMGLLSPNDTTTDDASATFATDISAGSLLGVALHEFAHALGRVPYGPPYSASGDIFDFTRFTRPGNRFFDDNIPTSAAYFSLNTGASDWADYGQTSDPSDFLNPPNSALTPEDPFNEFYDSGTLQYLTPVDLEQMDALGFHLKSDAPAADNADFNGENSGDVLIQNASGQIVYANMYAGVFQGWGAVANAPGWTIAGEGKISGAVDADVVIQNNSSGQIIYAYMAGGAFAAWVQVANAPGWKVVGVGDVNDDHYADVIIQNQTTGNVVYANMKKGVFTSWGEVAQLPGWTAAAVGDVNGDGYADVIAQNNSNGDIIYANMDNGVFSGWAQVADAPGWKVVGAGDIARLGDADVVIQNQSSGDVVYANMVNGAFSNWVQVANAPGWNVIGVEDVTGNGYDDVVIQNPSAGQTVYANMTGGTFQGWVNVANTSGFSGLTSPAGSGAHSLSSGETTTALTSLTASNLDPLYTGDYRHLATALPTWGRT